MTCNSAVAKERRIDTWRRLGRKMIENTNIHFLILLKTTSEPYLLFS